MSYKIRDKVAAARFLHHINEYDAESAARLAILEANTFLNILNKDDAARNKKPSVPAPPKPIEPENSKHKT